MNGKTNYCKVKQNVQGYFKLRLDSNISDQTLPLGNNDSNSDFVSVEYLNVPNYLNLCSPKQEDNLFYTDLTQYWINQ